MEQAIKLEIFPFSPFVMIPFWHTLAKKKLEEYKLDDSERPIVGTYKINNFKENRANLYLDSNSLNESIKTIGQVEVKVPGFIKNCNTSEAFDADNKAELFEQKSLAFYQELNDIATNPEKYDRVSSLNMFLLITFADLKYHMYKSAFASPIFKLEKVKISSRLSLNAVIEGKNLETFEATLKEFLTNEKDTPAVIPSSQNKKRAATNSSPLLRNFLKRAAPLKAMYSPSSLTVIIRRISMESLFITSSSSTY